MPFTRSRVGSPLSSRRSGASSLTRRRTGDDVFVLRLCATSLCYVSVLRLCATLLCYAFVLRLRITSLVLPQISIQLPFADLSDVLLPLLALCVEVAFADVVAQRLPDHRILLQVVERFVQIARQVVDTEAAALPVGHACDVLVHGLPGIDPLLDAVQTGGQLHAEREVGIR